MAQLGRALGLGPRGCRFKSCFSDHFVDNTCFSSDYRKNIGIFIPVFFCVVIIIEILNLFPDTYSSKNNF